jgi:drug/metabolite transporter (DMT)-like permease
MRTRRGPRLDAGLLLLLTPVLWGLTFPASKIALRRLPTFTFMAWTRGLGFLAIAAMVPLLRRGSAGQPRGSGGHTPSLRAVLLPGLLLGGLIFLGYTLQTEGLARTTATNAGFITGLYVVFVPLLAGVAFRQHVPRAAWLAVAISAGGLTLLSIRRLGAVHLHAGDLLVLGGAVAWAGHITAVGLYSPRFPAWMLSGAQMGVTAVLQIAVALAGPGLHPAAAAQGAVWPLLIITGVLGTGVAFTLQVMAQRTVTTTRAVVMLAGESMFSAAFAAVWTRDRLAAHQWLGAGLVLAAMAFSELKARRAQVMLLEPSSGQ